MDLGSLRRDYADGSLSEADVAPDPMVQFARWFEEARLAGVTEPNAMTLATADSNGRPSGRIVLLKGVTDGGFVFFTDFRSRKGRELAANPYAALVFHWQPLERQVRVSGQVARVDDTAAMAYFQSRPEGSRIGAWASEQSSVIADRTALEERVARLAGEFSGGDIPLPPHWGGFRVMPSEIEFWQGRSNRLHDRLVYTRTPELGWHLARLSP